MIIGYTAKDGKWIVSSTDEACWIRAVNPTEEELGFLSAEYGIQTHDLRAGLDDFELPRFEAENGYNMLYINTSRLAEDASWRVATLGIAVTPVITITVSNHETEVVNEFIEAKLRDPEAHCGRDVMLQLLMKATQLFLRDLHNIDTRNAELEKKLGIAMRNSLIFDFLALEKSLVHLRTAVNGNQLMLDKLRSQGFIADEARFAKLLEDIVVENKQACDMAEIYTDIMSNTMDAFASIINNNLNNVMKFLTSVAIVIAVPTIVIAFFSMNIPTPWSGSPHTIFYMLGIALGLTSMAVYVMNKKKLF